MCWWEVFTLETWRKAWLTGHPAPCLIPSQAFCWALAFVISHPAAEQGKEGKLHTLRSPSFTHAPLNTPLTHSALHTVLYTHGFTYAALSTSLYVYLLHTLLYTHCFTHTLYTLPYTYCLTFNFGTYFWLEFKQDDQKQNQKSPKLSILWH